MAKVNGPLFSLQASGKLANAIVYSVWKGIPYVREYVVPSNPNSLGQRNTRSATSFFSKYWKSLIQADKDSWIAAANAANFSPFNAYMKAGLQALAAGFAPSDNSTEARTGPSQTATPTALVISAGVLTGSVVLDGPETNELAIAIQVKETGAPAFAAGKNVVLYVSARGGTAKVVNVTGFDPAKTYDTGIYVTTQSGGVGNLV